MSKELVVAVICVIVALVTIGITVYLYIRENTLDGIREDAYQLFLKAEHMYTESNSGQKKMKWVLTQIYNIMPAWARFFITEATMEYVVQMWFNAVKDLLDDGKYNKSTKE
jgi:hypothetical protein